MAVIQPLVDLAAICYKHGIRHVVVSPGSRSAAITLSFARFGKFRMQVCIDERSAGFIALGMAQQTGIPTVLICTSGSAVYNFAPAVSEAFFQQIPLLVLSADRPKEWIHQYDGQTIYQHEIFGKHVKRSFEFLPDYDHRDTAWAVNRIANEAILLSSSVPQGPVHINIPVREPFYPDENDVFQSTENLRIISKSKATTELSSDEWNRLLDEFESSPRILIAGAQHLPDQPLAAALTHISEEWDIPVLADAVSNLTSDAFIHHHDLFLHAQTSTHLRPDLLITFGKSFVSKEFKQYIRRNPPRQHWHIGQDIFLTDATQTLTMQVPVQAAHFFTTLFEKLDNYLFVTNTDLEIDTSFKACWNEEEYKTRKIKYNFANNLTMLSDLTLLDVLNKQPSSHYQLHVGNSMAIRYVNALLDTKLYSGVFCNRGTSGIDGCVSTAIGAALVNERPTLLLVGDVSFLYDRNGFLIQDLPQNLRIIVVNNAGGNIFRMIDGPKDTLELETYFETRHRFTAENTCKDARIDYQSARLPDELEDKLRWLMEHDQIALLEIFTDPRENERVWKMLKALVRPES
ncbi:2-succinyl-5-enolpyruvyl-6-hydroxy-3-cyclohexene-1-carboxylic-acid synthase [Dyadobacter sandarakinus]|uniref:2-succinyl-5-enolpyruvyl-6-hydroxy-3-cyclohexene-1-carboxylate synthase n=1 Tax=Dyadobacter sandarakinus TaxID=2747268 RepID=A0ABX7I3B1_9BACT|nr:2-succinyl-5-enolpyruvyl-6-hydroxy-3-cyclohexene-1-carboxylic-acid synthase [Dyadobacter sandarakinus]QRR00440.1 2-succinyl-5-enolpyruvyl-6-hydroxy-3-cyclohexene-1-carboxylic-acid synthase [Dyadobacter sandarakinus]